MHAATQVSFSTLLSRVLARNGSTTAARSSLLNLQGQEIPRPLLDSVILDSLRLTVITNHQRTAGTSSCLASLFWFHLRLQKSLRVEEPWRWSNLCAKERNQPAADPSQRREREPQTVTGGAYNSWQRSEMQEMEDKECFSEELVLSNPVNQSH